MRRRLGYLKESFFLFVANNLPRISYSNVIRSRLVKLAGVNVGKNVIIYHNIEIAPIGGAKNITIEDGVFINTGVRFQSSGDGKILIRKNAMIGPRCQFETLNHSIETDENGKRSNVFYPIEVGEGVWIGAKSVILQGVSIGKGSVVAAGAVVNKDVPTNTLVGGVPSKLIREL